MKFAIPEISWHNRDPVLSVDFQPKCEPHEPLRLATGGTDSHVVIWYVSTNDNGTVHLEVAADLTRHQKAVNVVRWSPNGQLLASGDDEAIIFIWKQKTEKELKEPVQNLEQAEEQYKESWVIHKTLRGHMEDVLDISWSRDSLYLASGSVDNKLLIWDVVRGRYTSILADHKGFVQGVSWDPQGQLIASLSTDRVFRTFDVNSKKVVSRSSKAVLPFPDEHPLKDVKVRLYHDDTLQTFYRRLQFSPDGLLIAVPAGKIEPEQGKLDVKPMNAVYIYTRYSLKVPACVIPCGEPALVVRWAARARALRGAGPPAAWRGAGPPAAWRGAGPPAAWRGAGPPAAWRGAGPPAAWRGAGPPPAWRGAGPPAAWRGAGPPAAWRGAARWLLAVATRRAVLLYDTQQRTPVALISHIHYTRLTDLTWSPNGNALVASSTDGFCSVITFADGELGETMPEIDTIPETKETAAPIEVEQEAQKQETPREKTPEKEGKPAIQKIDTFIKFKAPTKKQKTEAGPQKTPVKLDVLEEVAMVSWSDNSNNDIIKPQVSKPMDVDDTPNEKVSEVIQIEDSEDMKLIYDETDTKLIESQFSKSESPNKSPDLEKLSPRVIIKPDDNSFLKQAKVTDIKESVIAKAAPSPKAPRRVSFVTLSSPKNKKKC